ncbi:MAG: hypothetical protein EHM72_08950 [Calditrichaeota bacterium]|nr:MAG: hypothetical protein EHM72_08950 [Calditrichota bacterium]
MFPLKPTLVKRHLQLMAKLLLVLVGCLSAKTEDYIRLLTFDHLIFVYQPEVYSPERLHNYINGEAELYRNAGLAEMATVIYADPDDSSKSFTLDIYQMESPLTAFGIYSHFRKPEHTTRTIGNEGMITKMNLRFWQANYYGNLTAGTTDSCLTLTLQQFAEMLCSRLPTTEIPIELTLLPQEFQIPGSLKYIHRNYRSIPRLDHIIEAAYQHNDTIWKAFVLLCRSREEQQQGLGLLSSIENCLVFPSRQTNFIYGVINFNNEQSAVEFLQQFE